MIGFGGWAARRVAYDPHRAAARGRRAVGKHGLSDIAERFTIVIQPAALQFQALANLPLLRSAREAGLILPSSCRMCRLRSGQVSYLIEWPGLSAEEKADGFILPCVALPGSALVIESEKIIDLAAP